MDLELRDWVAIVTGGNRGIRRAIATTLADEGAVVPIIGRDGGAAEMAASAIAENTGAVVDGLRADAGSDDDVRAAVADIAARRGRIDILANCAAQPAGQGPAPSLAEITDDRFWSDINVKVLGYLRFARAVVAVMQQRGFGRIINIGGLAARQTGSIIGSIRNVGVAALTKNLADGLRAFGINVTCVHPSLTRTEKTPAGLEYHAQAAGLSPEAIEQRIIDNTAARHFVTAEDVAHLVTFLASPKSIALSGDVIAAGGGQRGAIYY